MGHARRRLDQIRRPAERLELAKAAIARRFTCVALVLEVRDRGKRVEHATEPGTQLASLVARGCRTASRPLRLEVECLQDRGVGGRGRQRITGIATALHQLIRKLGLEALERCGVTAERAG